MAEPLKSLELYISAPERLTLLPFVSIKWTERTTAPEKFVSSILVMQEAVPEKEPIPGAVIAVQTFGDFLGFNPHCHILVTDGCFYGNKGMFRVAPPLELKKLEAIFRHKVFRMLLSKGKVTQEMITMLSTWRHSGFNVFCGNCISPKNDTDMENLARYIIRASFSQERMHYLEQKGKVVYTSKDGKTTKGLPPCVPISQIKASRWSDTTAITATSHGEKGKGRERMRISLASSMRRGMKRPSGVTGRA